MVSFDERGRPHSDAAATALAVQPFGMKVSDGTSTIQIDITPNTGFIE
jgi:hypothetical protein